MASTSLIHLLALWTLGTSATQGIEYQSHASIRQAAKTHAAEVHNDQKQVDLRVSNLDSRLRLKQCDIPIEAFSPPGKNRGGKLSVGVRCLGKNKWTIYVPVNVDIRKKILVANRELSRNTIISADDIRLEERSVSKLRRGYFQDPQKVVGKTLSHDLREGAALIPRRLQNTAMVKKGSMVTILARTGPISVRMEGTALANGTQGERIKVRNRSSSRLLEARVTAPGIVEVSL